MMQFQLSKNLKGALLTAVLISSTARAENPAAINWLQNEEGVAVNKMLQAISRSDTRRGTVVASPQKESPNYYFYWIRDGALTMEVVLDMYKNAVDSQTRAAHKQRLYDFIDLTAENQVSNAISGLGEPKFNVDGSPFMDAWGRPQNDGPALRAATLAQFAQILLKEGQEQYVRERLYDGKLPSNSVIKRDLEYVAHNWKASSFDLWEEIKGTHFYTLRVQRKALVLGAELADRLGDTGAAAFYREQAALVERQANYHLDYSLGLIVPTYDRTEGIDYKTSNLDAAVILGFLHGETPHDNLSATHDLILSSLLKISERFRNDYSINQRPDLPGVAIGRYPEDRYGGQSFNGGNPWVLLTMGFAETLYKAAAQLKAAGEVTVSEHTVAFYNDILKRSNSTLTVQASNHFASSTEAGRAQVAEITNALVNEGDSYVAKVMYHANPDGSLNEQIDRSSGYMTSVTDLTWNYASVLTAIKARHALSN